jgi:hypothetical protein
MSDMIDRLINDIDSMRDLTADELESVSGAQMATAENASDPGHIYPQK